MNPNILCSNPNREKYEIRLRTCVSQHISRYKKNILYNIGMNVLTIIIGRKGLALLTTRRTARKDVNKRASKSFVDKILIMVC